MYLMVVLGGATHKESESGPSLAVVTVTPGSKLIILQSRRYKRGNNCYNYSKCHRLVPVYNAICSLYKPLIILLAFKAFTTIPLVVVPEDELRRLQRAA